MLVDWFAADRAHWTRWLFGDYENWLGRNLEANSLPNSLPNITYSLGDVSLKYIQLLSLKLVPGWPAVVHQSMIT